MVDAELVAGMPLHALSTVLLQGALEGGLTYRRGGASTAWLTKMSLS